MEFVFDIKKTVAAVGFLCSLNGGKIEVREMLKMLYWAEREALLGWRRSITGDMIFAMDQGPVLSRVYNLARYRLRDSDMAAWKAMFTPRHGHTIFFQDKAIFDDGPLSEREETALKNGFAKIRELQAEYGNDGYIDALHHLLPEWSNPNGTSVKMEPEKLLAMKGVEAKEIVELSAELDALNSAKLALQQ